MTRRSSGLKKTAKTVYYKCGFQTGAAYAAPVVINADRGFCICYKRAVLA